MRLVVDESGDVVASYDADEFGNPTVVSESGVSTDQRWVGGLGYKDEVAGTGLYYVRQRYFDPKLGRWLGRDPYSSVLNPYSYVDQNPINFTDPTGEIKRDASGNVIFEPFGDPQTAKQGGQNGKTLTVQAGHIYADDGTPILALKNLSSDRGFDQNCHGLTFGDGQFIISDTQVEALLQGDGYKFIPTKSKGPWGPMTGDVVIYRNEAGEIVHSGVIDKMTMNKGVPNMTVWGKGGNEPAPSSRPIKAGEGGAWPYPGATYTIHRCQGPRTRQASLTRARIMGKWK